MDVWRLTGSVERLYGGCKEAVRRIWGGCLEGVVRLSGGYGKTV